MRKNVFKDLFEQELTKSKNRVSKNRSNKNTGYSMQHFESVSEDHGIQGRIEKAVITTEELASLPLAVREDFAIQKFIREIFGKIGVNNSDISSHPDFSSLQFDGSTINQYICTIFFDIKGSTRLSLLYDLEQVFVIKNSMLKATIEIIRAFDGYVHRLMGDAVMAFFGSSTKSKEDAVIDAINCCMTLNMFMEQSVKPSLERLGFETVDFGFRVGCDFGEDSQVLWGAYGFDSVGEISPTGLPVDMASKLQGLADKNSVMFGQGLLDFIVWPNRYSKVKNSCNEDVLYVTPNITNRNKKPLNYRMKMLDYGKTLSLSALPIVNRAKNCDTLLESEFITYKCYVEEDDEEKEYISASRCLNRGLSLEFEVSISNLATFSFPLKLQLYKRNNGPNVPESEGIETLSLEKTVNKAMPSQVSDQSPQRINVPECTAYRGLHTMRCVLTDCFGIKVYENSIGVFIR